MASCYLVVYVITFLSDDLESVLDGDPVENIEEILFFYDIDWELFLTVDLGDDLVHTAATGFALPWKSLHFVL